MLALLIAEAAMEESGDIPDDVPGQSPDEPPLEALAYEVTEPATKKERRESNGSRFRRPDAMTP